MAFKDLKTWNKQQNNNTQVKDKIQASEKAVNNRFYLTFDPASDLLSYIDVYSILNKMLPSIQYTVHQLKIKQNNRVLAFL